MMSTALSQRSFDDIPGTLDKLELKEMMRVRTDTANFFKDYAAEHSKDGNVPKMIKFTVSEPTVALLSHECVKEWHQYEINGQKIRRGMPDFIAKLT